MLIKIINLIISVAAGCVFCRTHYYMIHKLVDKTSYLGFIIELFGSFMSGFSISYAFCLLNSKTHKLNLRSKLEIGEKIIVFCAIYACLSVVWDYIESVLDNADNVQNILSVFKQSLRPAFQQFGLILTHRGSWIPLTLLILEKKDKPFSAYSFNSLVGLLFGIVLSGSNIVFVIIGKCTDSYYDLY
jgi:hypothetical protein